MKISDLITLKPLSIKHADELYEAVTSSRQNLTRYLPWAASIIDTQSVNDYINERIYSYKAGAQWLAIYVDKQFSGVFGIKEINPNTKIAELGYWLADVARGKQVMSEVLSKMLPYLKTNSDVKTIELQCLEDNHASIAVAKRAGAQFKHYHHEALFLAGRYQRLGVYQIQLT